MTAEELERRVRLGEDSTVDFKGLVHNGFQSDAEDIARAIVALANMKGGHLLLGVGGGHPGEGPARGRTERRRAQGLPGCITDPHLRLR